MLVVCLLHVIDSLSKPGVPVILNSIIGSTHKLFRYEAPLLILLVSEYKQHPLFFDTPLGPFNFGIEMVEPPLTARLAASTVQVFL